MSTSDTPFPSDMDASTKFGAWLLCACIINYWRSRGYAVTTERYQVPGSETWGVRSNLLNGLPRGGRTAFMKGEG